MAADGTIKTVHAGSDSRARGKGWLVPQPGVEEEGDRRRGGKSNVFTTKEPANNAMYSFCSCPRQE